MNIARRPRIIKFYIIFMFGSETLVCKCEKLRKLSPIFSYFLFVPKENSMLWEAAYSA
jgi:hypothetical protein